MALQIQRVTDRFSVNDFRRLESFQFRLQSVQAVDLHDVEATAAHVEAGNAGILFVLMHSHQQIFLTFFQQGFIGDGTWRDDTNDFAFDRSLGCCRVTDLFTNRDRLAKFEQSRQIGIHRVIRNAGHGYRFTGGLAAMGQGNVEEFGRTPGIVKEQLVKVAHAIEQ